MGLRDLQERKRLERTIFSWPALIGLCVAIVLVFWNIINAWQTQRMLDRDIARLDEEIAKANDMREQYEAQFQEMQTSDGIDREARARFNLKKPGEAVVLFVDETHNDQAPPASGAAGVYQATMQWFQKLFSR